jgi:hypothetical protein
MVREAITGASCRRGGISSRGAEREIWRSLIQPGKRVEHDIKSLGVARPKATGVRLAAIS